MRLIDVDALKEDWHMGNKCEECEQDARNCNLNITLTRMDVCSMLDTADTVDAKPVSHGHWNGWAATHWTKKYDDNGDPIYREHTYYQCSECRRGTVVKSAYCPGCGAKMDEEGNNGNT